MSQGRGRLLSMPLNEQGVWVPRLFPKQIDVLNDTHRALLVAGPRKSGKTLAVLHKIVKHMWTTPGARVAMFSRVIKKAKEGGTWNDMHEIVLKEWIDAGQGLVYTTRDSEGNPGPKIAGDTRTPHFKIRNWFGVQSIAKGEAPGLMGESECKLFSLQHDQNIESVMLEKRFSMIYFSELANFDDPRVLAVSRMQLRMVHLAMEQQSWLADTNPSEDGEMSWIFQKWYIMRNQTYDEYKVWQEKRSLPVEEEELFEEEKRSLGLIEILPKENPFLSTREYNELRSSCAHDAGLFARHVEGKWVFGDGNKSLHFSRLFQEHVHVIGNTDGPNEEEHEILLPSDKCTNLILGFDLGDVNHSAHIIERQVTPNGSYFFVLGELVSIEKEVSNEDFTVALLEMVEDMERRANKRFKITCWSDNSSLEKYSASGDAYPFQQVHTASNGRFILEGVKKGPGSVRARVALLKQLLGYMLKPSGEIREKTEQRIWVSADCPFTIKMFRELKRGKTSLSYIVPDGNQHPFDSLTYPLMGEMGEELELQINLKSRGGGLIQVS